LDKQAIIETIGAAKYRALGTWAQQNISQFGFLTMPEEQDEETLNQINALIWESGLANFQQVELAMQFYRDLPFMHFPYVAYEHYNSFSTYAKSVFWDGVRAHLFQGNEALSQPLMVVMMMQFLADEQLFEEAWAELTGPQANRKLLEGIIELNAPVPFELQKPVFIRLIGERASHPAICRGLLGSLLLGNIDAAWARSIFQQLDLPANDENMITLRKELQEG
jgi:hypothetical protein